MLAVRGHRRHDIRYGINGLDEAIHVYKTPCAMSLAET